VCAAAAGVEMRLLKVNSGVCFPVVHARMVVLYCAVLCCAVLCCAVLCCAVLCLCFWSAKP
jgi:hypothetical protein